MRRPTPIPTVTAFPTTSISTPTATAFPTSWKPMLTPTATAPATGATTDSDGTASTTPPSPIEFRRSATTTATATACPTKSMSTTPAARDVDGNGVDDARWNRTIRTPTDCRTSSIPTAMTTVSATTWKPRSIPTATAPVTGATTIPTTTRYTGQHRGRRPTPTVTAPVTGVTTIPTATASATRKKVTWTPTVTAPATTSIPTATTTVFRTFPTPATRTVTAFPIVSTPTKARWKLRSAVPAAPACSVYCWYCSWSRSAACQSTQGGARGSPYSCCWWLRSRHVPEQAHSPHGTVCSERNFDNCWYAGVGLGLSHVDPEGQAGGWSTNDDGDSGFKLYGGYQFKPLWSVELAC